MIKPKASDEEQRLASQALALVDERDLEPKEACNQVLFGQDGDQYTEEGGRLFHPVLRCLREMIRKRNAPARQMVLHFSPH